MIWLYRIFYILARTLLTLAKPFLPATLRHWIGLRNRPLEKTKTYSSCFWFHASSGEIEYCKSVIRLMKKRFPTAHIVLTYSSPSAEKLFHNIQTEVDQFIPLPWDQPAQIAELIRYLNPKIIILSRTDIWPELARQARNFKIKIGVISYSPRLKSLTLPLTKWILNQLDFISCIDEQSKNKLRILTDTPISADGDTRFDQVFFRLSQNTRLQIVSTPYWVFGSTWPEDEAVLFPLFRSFLDEGYKLVLSPHEVSTQNIRRLQKELTDRGHTHSLFSEYSDPMHIQIRSEIMIMDRIGYLADCYRSAAIAFVGGSFKDKVHSVMEPLCCGLPVLVGPFYRNNPEAVRYAGSYVFPAQTSAEFKNKAQEALQLDSNTVADAMKKNLNASEKVLNLILGIAQEKSDS